MNRVCQFHIALYFSPKIQLAKFSELLRTSGIRSLPTFSISTEHDRTVDFHRTLFQQLWEQVLIFGTFPRISFSSLFRLRFFPSSLLDFHSLSGLYLGLFVRSTQAIYLFSSCLARRDASPSTLPPRRFLFRSIISLRSWVPLRLYFAFFADVFSRRDIFSHFLNLTSFTRLRLVSRNLILLIEVWIRLRFKYYESGYEVNDLCQIFRKFEFMIILWVLQRELYLRWMS